MHRRWGSQALADGAFGLGVESRWPYRLRLARYPAAAEVVEDFVGGRPALALDAGVGRGRVGKLATSEGLRWVGLDISAPRLAEASQSGRYELVRGSIEALPFPKGRFDVVCCIQVLEHFDAPRARQLAGSLGELLRPGGLLLLSVPIFPPGSMAALAAINRVRSWAGRGPWQGEGHLSHFDLKRAKSLLPAGYTTTDVRGVRLFSLTGKALEDRYWWYRAHRWAGRRFPAWTIEVNIAARKHCPAA
jgi:SAM-dependent methyltransferase